MDNDLRSYKLSPHLRAEVRQQGPKRNFARLNFKTPKIDFSKLPIKSSLRIAFFIGLIITVYVGIKTGYEKAVYAAETKQIAQQEKYEEYLAGLKTEISALSDDAYELAMMSRNYLKEKDGQKAEVAAVLSTEKEPYWRDGFINLGHIYLSVNKFDKAKEALEKAIEIDPLSGQAHYLLSLVHQELNDMDSAKESFARANSCGYETEIGG